MGRVFFSKPGEPLESGLHARNRGAGFHDENRIS